MYLVGGIRLFSVTNFNEVYTPKNGLLWFFLIIKAGARGPIVRWLVLNHDLGI
jgi:hypothetical protein